MRLLEQIKTNLGLNDESKNVTGTLVGSKFAIDVKIVDNKLIITDQFGQQVTITDIGGKMSMDVNVTNITITADSDSIETRKMPMKEYLDEVSSTVLYYGEAVIGTATSAAGWRIKRVTQVGGSTLIDWASPNFDQIWDNRTALSYG